VLKYLNDNRSSYKTNKYHSAIENITPSYNSLPSSFDAYSIRSSAVSLLHFSKKFAILLKYPKLLYHNSFEVTDNLSYNAGQVFLDTMHKNIKFSHENVYVVFALCTLTVRF